MEKKKVICTGWIGRFGNRCHSYLYGKYIEDKFGAKFYVPASGWDGEVIFKNPAPKYDSNFQNVVLHTQEDHMSVKTLKKIKRHLMRIIKNLMTILSLLIHVYKKHTAKQI